MVDRVRTTLSIEALEDRTLPSAASAAVLLSYSGAVIQPAATAQMANLFVDGPVAVAVQTNGDAVEVGEAATSPTGVSDTAGVLALARFTAAGQLDPSFGAGGEVRTTIGSVPGESCALNVQTDGTIVLTVAIQGALTDTVARFAPDGSIESVVVQSLPNVTWTITLSEPGTYSSEGAEVTYDDSVGIVIEVRNNQGAAEQNNITTGTTTAQVPWTRPADPGPQAGLGAVPRPPLFLPVTAAPLHTSGFPNSISSPSTAVLLQLPWTRASDSLLSASNSIPPAEYSAILLAALASLEDGESHLSVVESSNDGTPRTTWSTTPSGTELPAYLRDAPLVSTVLLAAPSSDAPPAPVRPVLRMNEDGLAAYLVGPDAGRSTLSRVTGDLIAESASADPGLAAVDAAFGLLAQEEKPANLAMGSVPAGSRGEQSPQRRGISWPMWFVLVVAASGGGAAYACPGFRRSTTKLTSSNMRIFPAGGGRPV